MQSHYDPDHDPKETERQKKMLADMVSEVYQKHQFMDGLEKRASAMKSAGESKIASDGLDEAAGWESEGVSVRKLDDDPQGILRISIGGGDHLPVNANYCTFRGPREVCITLLERALAALKADR